MKVKNFRELKAEAKRKGLENALNAVYMLEKKEGILNSRADIEKRLVEWWNEMDTSYDISMQRMGFVLMQEMKRKSRRKKLRKVGF